MSELQEEQHKQQAMQSEDRWTGGSLCFDEQLETTKQAATRSIDTAARTSLRDDKMNPLIKQRRDEPED